MRNNDFPDDQKNREEEVDKICLNKRKTARDRARRGFTLAEMLITVAIIGILAAFGFVVVIRYQKSLKQTELDDTAREIFVAAQNHMTVSRASGNWDTYVAEAENQPRSVAKKLGNAMGAGAQDSRPSDYDGSLGSWKTVWADGTLEKDEAHDFRYVTVSADGESDPVILSMILPDDAIDETLRGNGNIIIEYDAETATVYGVWYCKPGDLEKAKSTNATGTSPESVIRSIASTEAYKNENRTSRSSRMKSDPMVGYYGGGTSSVKKGGATEDSMSAIIENDDRLMLEVAVPEQKESDSAASQRAYTVKATVTGQTSGNSREISLGTSKDIASGSTTNLMGGSGLNGVIQRGSGSSNKYRLYYYTLDSVTDGAKGHFASQFCNSASANEKPLIPGENLTITVRLVYGDETEKSDAEKKDTLSADGSGKSVTLSCNSLFANGSNSGSDKGTARIAYGRHLQNLSTVVSGVNFTGSTGAQGSGSRSGSAVITKAKMLNDLDWSNMTIRFLSEKAMKRTTGSTSAGGGAGTASYSVSSYNNTWNTAVGAALTAAGNFYSISDSALTEFNGNGFAISNLQIGAASATAGSGTGTPDKAASSPKTTTPVETNDSEGSTCAGLFGYIDAGTTGKNTMTIQWLTLKNPTAEKAAYAGFVVGKTNRETKIQNVTVTGDTALSLTADQAAGGILGEAANSSTSILYAKVLSGKTLTIAANSGNDSNTAKNNGSNSANSNNNANAGGILGCQIGSGTGTEGTGTGLRMENCTVSVSGKANSTSANAGNADDSEKYLKITGAYSAGGVLGYCAAGEPGSTSEGNPGNTTNYAGSVTIKNCNVFGVGNQDLISAKKAAGGLAAYISSKEKLDVENDAVSMYVAASDTKENSASTAGVGFGGLIGYLNSTGANGTISKCYVGGRTAEGAYNETVNNNSTQGRYNIRGNGYVGGFIGQIEGSNTLSVENCFTTASAYSGTSASTKSGNGAGTSAQAGSFIANSTDASLSVKSCYSTGLTNGTVFVGGSVVNNLVNNSQNYYLAGVNKSDLTGAGVKKANVNDAGTPFAKQTSSVDTNKYDSSLKGNYPYQMISGQSVYYGDWVVPKAQDLEGSFGILYYEIVQHGTGSEAAKNKSVYYHGYIGNAVAGEDKTNDSYREVNTLKTLSNEQFPGALNNHGLLMSENGGDYVTEDGYILLVSENYKTSDVDVQLGNTTTALNQLSWIQQYDQILNELNIRGYHAFYVNALSIEHQIQWDSEELHFLIKNRLYPKEDKNTKEGIKFNPFFADYVYRASETPGNYQIRSAHQLNILFNDLKGGKYLGPSGSGSGTVVTQTMDISYNDISYNNDNVNFTEFGKEVNYTSPQLDTMANTYQGKTNQNNYVYKLDNLKKSLLAESENKYQNYTLNNLHITNMSADSLVGNNYGTLSNLIVTDSKFSNASLVEGENTGTIKDCDISNISTDKNGVADKNSGTITNIKITNSKIKGNGLVGYNFYNKDDPDNPDVYNDNVKISDCKIYNAIIGGNGAVGSNHGTLQNIELQSVMVNKNGFVGDNVGIINGCNVINAEIGQNGFANTNSKNGKIIKCQLYADSEKYSDYKKTTEKAYYKPALLKQNEQGNGSMGYDLLVCGLSNMESDSNTATQYRNDQTAGFIDDNSATISDCSYSGKVYGSKVAAGFFLNNFGTIESSYANALVTASDTVAGFGYLCNNGAVNYCHSIGMLLDAKQGAGFIYNITANRWPASLKNDYSAIWKSTVKSFYFFNCLSTVDIYNSNIRNCAYLTSVFCDKDKIKENNSDFMNRSGKIKGYSYKELQTINDSGFDIKASESTTKPYYQYTSKNEKVYPFPMPDGMIAYGDWSWNKAIYSIRFEGNGGTPVINDKEISRIDDIDYVIDVTLPDCEASAGSNWTFVGWQDDRSGKMYKAGDKVSGLATSGTVTLIAQWKINNERDFNYSSEEVQKYTAQADGWYKLEVWGANGGNATFNSDSAQGGRGGYSVNYVYLTQGQKIDVYIGGCGKDATNSGLGYNTYDQNNDKSYILSGGWNGGGKAYSHSLKNHSYVSYWLFGSGGGASHMSLHLDTSDNAPKTLADYSEQQKFILLVAGGGGGAGLYVNALGTWINDDNTSRNAGGYGGGNTGKSGKGVSKTANYPCYTYGTGGSETEGGTVNEGEGRNVPAVSLKSGSFGQGGSPIAGTGSDSYDLGAGGGGGWYGGGSSYVDTDQLVAPSAGGGSGYVKSSGDGSSIENGTTRNGETSIAGENVPTNPSNDGNGHGRITYLPSYSFSITDKDNPLSPDGNNTIKILKNTSVQLTLKDAQNQYVNDATWKVTDPNGNVISLLKGTGSVRTFTSSSAGTYIITATGPDEVVSTSVTIIVKEDDGSNTITGNAAPNAGSGKNSGSAANSNVAANTGGSTDSTTGGGTSAGSQKGSGSSLDSAGSADESSSKKVDEDGSDESIVSSSSS